MFLSYEGRFLYAKVGLSGLIGGITAHAIYAGIVELGYNKLDGTSKMCL